LTLNFFAIYFSLMFSEATDQSVESSNYSITETLRQLVTCFRKQITFFVAYVATLYQLSRKTRHLLIVEEHHSSYVSKLSKSKDIPVTDHGGP
jgi:ABC-type long-subunit fatty acid transport system fused permease/ATPase subunit